MSLLTLPTRTIFATSTVCGVGDAQPADELDRQAEALHVGGDLRAAAVHDDRVHPDVLEQHDVARELLAQRRVLHRGAAVLDDDRAAVELADVGQRLEERADVRRHGQSSRRVLGVDRHVLVPEVGEEDLGLVAVAGQPDRRTRPRRRATRCGERRRVVGRSRCRATQTWTPSIAMSTASGAASGSAMPTAWTIRPQLGSPPCSAVLTSGELATRARRALDVSAVAAAHDDAADALGALAVADDRERQLAQQRVERLAEAQLVLGLGLDAPRRSRRSP